MNIVEEELYKTLIQEATEKKIEKVRRLYSDSVAGNFEDQFWKAVVDAIRQLEDQRLSTALDNRAIINELTNILNMLKITVSMYDSLENKEDDP